MNRSKSSFATSMLLAGTLVGSAGLATTAIADGHETVEALKKQLASAEKKMAAVSKDRDSLYEQLLGMIEEVEGLENSLETNAEAAGLQAKLDQVTAGRDYLAEKLQAQIASSKESNRELQAELDSAVQGRDYISDRLDKLFADSKSAKNAQMAQVARIDSEANSVAEVALAQIQSALAERDAAQQKLEAAETTIAKAGQDMESVINGRSYIEKQLQNAKSNATSQATEMQAKLDASESANAKLQLDIESIINGRTYIENQAKMAKSASADEIAKLQSELNTVTVGRDHLSERLNIIYDNAKAESAKQATTIASLQGEIEKMNAPSWSETISATMRDNLASVEGVEITPIDDLSVNVRIANVGLFKTANTQLSSAGQKILDQIGFALLSAENMRVLVTGHTDNIPVGESSRYADNEDLSNRRALEAMNHLGAYGVPFGNLSASGLADTTPIASNATTDGRQMNRRVELVLSPL